MAAITGTAFPAEASAAVAAAAGSAC